MILPVIENRRSVREFSAREVPEEALLDLLRAAQFAPTGMNNRAVEFLVLRDASAKKRLFDILEPKQAFITEAPVVVIPVTDTRKTIVPVPDLAIASSFLLLQAEASGLGSVWKHIAPDDAPKVAEAFGLAPEYTLICALPVGFPREKLPPHKDKEFAPAKIHQDRW
jgi:nitroreductase